MGSQGPLGLGDTWALGLGTWALGDLGPSGPLALGNPVALGHPLALGARAPWARTFFVFFMSFSNLFYNLFSFRNLVINGLETS